VWTERRGETRQNKNEQLIKTYYLSTSEKHQRGISSAFRFSVDLWLALGLGHSREMSRTSRLRQTKPEGAANDYMSHDPHPSIQSIPRSLVRGNPRNNAPLHQPSVQIFFSLRSALLSECDVPRAKRQLAESGLLFVRPSSLSHTLPDTPKTLEYPPFLIT
jgi:hypothetical protein